MDNLFTIVNVHAQQEVEVSTNQVRRDDDEIDMDNLNPFGGFIVWGVIIVVGYLAYVIFKKD